MISILMPCYNAGKYLRKSIRSIQDSTVQDFEIICVNDGSTDNTLEVLKDLQQDDFRIIIYSREERGYAATMNEAIERASGDYILNVDPDDWIEPTMLERLLEEMDDDLDFVKCGFTFEFKDSSIDYTFCQEKTTFCPRLLPPEDKMNFFVSQVAIWSCLIRRSFVEKHKIRLNETPGAAYQDTAFIFYIDTLAEKVKVIPDTLYHYNKTNENASTASHRYPYAPSVEFRKMASWCMDHPEYGIFVRSVLCKSRFGAYMWNMSRIDKEDRLGFAKVAQEDFLEDWAFIDVRMFDKEEYTAYMVGKTNPPGLVDAFKDIEKGVYTK